MGIGVISHGGFVKSCVSLQMTNALVRVRKTRTEAGAYPLRLVVMAMAKVMIERYPGVGEILTQSIYLLPRGQ